MGEETTGVVKRFAGWVESLEMSSKLCLSDKWFDTKYCVFFILCYSVEEFGNKKRIM